MYTVYHNPRCKKSRAGLQHVLEKKMEHQVREYLKEPLSEEELTTLLMKLHKKPLEMIRTQEGQSCDDQQSLKFHRPSGLLKVRNNCKKVAYN